MTATTMLDAPEEKTPLEAWTTEDELHYVKNIGRWAITAHHDAARHARRVQRYLRNYLAAAAYRHNWGDVDGERVMAFARQRLLTLEIQAG